MRWVIGLGCLLWGATQAFGQGLLTQIVPEPEAAPATELPSQAAPAPGRAWAWTPEPPLWRITVAAGNAWVNAKALRSVFQTGALAAETLDVDWQPSDFGIRVGAGATAGDERDRDLQSRYDASDLHVAAIYSVLGPTRGAELIVFAGAMRDWHSVALDDGEVRLHGSGADYGPLLGFDLGSPPFYGLSLLIRGSISEQRTELSTFAFRHYLVERSLMIGGSYAF